MFGRSTGIAAETAFSPLRHFDFIFCKKASA